MGNIGIELVRSSFDVLEVLGPSQSFASLIAVIAAHVVFRTAASAAGGHLAAGHGDEGPVGPLDDL